MSPAAAKRPARERQRLKVVLVCRASKNQTPLCRSVPLDVPDRPACNPGASISLTQGTVAEDCRCPECGCSWRITTTDLDRIIAERTSRSWGEPITRRGGGRVRVSRPLSHPTAMMFPRDKR